LCFLVEKCCWTNDLSSLADKDQLLKPFISHFV
jgi:hypothetical protein